MEGIREQVEDNSAAVAAAAAAGFTLSPSHGMAALPNGAYSPQYPFSGLHSSPTGPGPAQQQQPPQPNQQHHHQQSYDPMFGGVPTNAFSSPAPWQAEDGSTRPPIAVAPSPGAGSHNGSTATGEEKDPFLSLLEQLAENESVRGGSEFDFFLGGTGGTA